MGRIELITSKEYWVETLEVMQMNRHTDYDIAVFIVDKIKEATDYSQRYMKENKQLVCPECKSTQVTIHSKTESRHCLRCNISWGK